MFFLQLFQLNFIQVCSLSDVMRCQQIVDMCNVSHRHCVVMVTTMTIKSFFMESLTDLPPAFWFEEIYEAFPDAKVILSVRDNEGVWAHSWVKQNELIQTFSGFLNRVLVKWPVIIVRRIRGKYTKFELFHFVLKGVYGKFEFKIHRSFQEEMPRAQRASSSGHSFYAIEEFRLCHVS